jgi:nitroreductase
LLTIFIIPFFMLSTTDTNALIRQRRSTFPAQYTGEQVDDAIIWQILENANWAPTHGKTEPWRFIVMTGEKLAAFGDFQAEAYRKNTLPENFEEAKFEKLRQNPRKASHIIAIYMKRQESGKIPEIEEIEATACAVQNMYLTATAYQVGAFWSTGGATYLPEGKEYLGLSEQEKLLGFFYVGVIGKPSAEGVRKPIQDKVRWI